MSKLNIHTNVMVTGVILALVLCAMTASPVFADGETPPPDSGATQTSDDGTTQATPTAEPSGDATLAPSMEATPTAEAPMANEGTSTEEPMATEAPPLEGETASGSESNTNEASVTPTEPEITEDETTESAVTEIVDVAAELLSELPEETGMMLINTEGETVPLASEEAAEILVYGDPIWCPSGVAPKPLVGGCSDSYGSIASLVASYPTGFPTNGTIWVQSGAAGGGTIDGSGAWAAKNKFSITIQGGWSGTPGSKALDPANPTSVFSDPLMIVYWKGSITLKNLTLDGVSYNNGFENVALTVVTQGNIVLDKVVVQNSINNGAGVAHGALLGNSSGTGSIKVTNSTFNNNEGMGLAVQSKGSITLKNVSAYLNGRHGVSILESATKSVNISNMALGYNGVDGLNVVSNGSITLNRVTSTYNSQNGATLVRLGPGTYTVYVNGVNSFNRNGSDGLNVYSTGAVKVSATEAISNGLSGVKIDNSTASTSAPVTIAGFLNVMWNRYRGLEISSRGKISAANISAIFNDNAGAYLTNESGSNQPVVLSGNNVFLGNANAGLVVRSRGAITLSNLNVESNSYSGVTIKNNFDPTVQMPVTINGNNVFHLNGDTGLFIESYGKVTLNNLSSLSNYGSGVYVENYGGTYPRAVTLNGVNLFNGNAYSGLVVFSKGAITVSKITAANNDGGGAYLWNFGTAQANVKITGYGVFHRNGLATSDAGLEIDSHGAVTLANINASFNLGTGADIYTIGLAGGSPHAVTLTGTNSFNFNGNQGDESGLIINADGNITINNLSASSNYHVGASLNNFSNWSSTGFSSFGSVKITGYGHFTSNGNYGLAIGTHGSVSLSRIAADANGVVGVEIFADGNVTLMCSSITGSYFGLKVDGSMNPTAGILTLKGVITYYHVVNETLDVAGVVRSNCP